MKSILKSVFISMCMLALALVAGAQANPTFTPFNPPPCDFSDQFYQDNGLDLGVGSELNAEKDGRFGTFRQTGPPANGSQVNWLTDSTCSTNDPIRRNFRILATTGGNQDDGNSPFTNNTQETPEFISILAFLHNGNVFIATGSFTDTNEQNPFVVPPAVNPKGSANQNYSRTVGAIDGGLDGIQNNTGNTISITQGTDPEINPVAAGLQGLNPRGFSMRFLVQSFPAFASPIQTVMVNGQPQFAPGPCSYFMNANIGLNIPSPCFLSSDRTVNGQTVSNAATPNLRQDWRFTTNRNAMDLDQIAALLQLADVATDQNCIDVDKNDPNNCNAIGAYRDSPFGYFCDDLLGIWLVHYVWFTTAPSSTGPSVDPGCNSIENKIGMANGFSLDKTPIILTENELIQVESATTTLTNNPNIPANTQCAFDEGEDGGGGDGGAVWLVCPALPDPRNGAIASDAFLDAVQLSPGNYQDQVIFKAFTCLQDSGKFCNE